MSIKQAKKTSNHAIIIKNLLTIDENNLELLMYAVIHSTLNNAISTTYCKLTEEFSQISGQFFRQFEKTFFCVQDGNKFSIIISLRWPKLNYFK